MSHSELGPHSGQIRLKDGTRIATTKKYGRWHAKGFPDYPSQAALERAIEQKRARTKATTRKGGAGKPRTMWSFGQAFGFTANSKQNTKPWWWL